MSAKPDLSERGTSSIAVLGAGTWGAVLAQFLQRNGHRVTAWDFYPSVVDSLDKTRMHSNLPGFRISEEIRFTPDLADAVRDAQVCVMVVPPTAVRATCESIRSTGDPESIRTWILCSKGIEQDTLLPLHDVMADALGNSCAERIGVLSGPSHAEEVARGLPTTIVASASDPAVASEIQRLFIQPRFRVYTHDDVLGVELGGALKNVIAIAAGISDGMGF
ncbi:NAD(P)-binding domain-containing protein, partial [Candidatus Sumerlaeota bacterium]|nr:NAD(P)-binding domain-containing protein [Candidatus Sumerlaeota bacterium]